MSFSISSRVISRAWVCVVTTIFGLFSPVISGELDWSSHRFILSEHEFRIDLPKSESLEFPVKRVKETADINDLSNYESWSKAIQLFDKYWDYRQRWTFGSVGSLRINAMVRLSSNEFDATAVNSTGSAHAMKEDVRRRSRIKQSMALGSLGVSSINFSLRNLNGKNWFQYAEENVDIYVTEIDDRHYLEIRFLFINNSRDGKTDWRQRATSDEMKVMNSVVFRNHPSLSNQ